MGYREQSNETFISVDLAIPANGTVGPEVRNGSTLFSVASPLSWSCADNGTACQLTGQPEYGPGFNLLQEEGSRRSPVPMTLRFEVDAVDDSADASVTTGAFEVDIEVAGCVDLRASFVGCDGNASSPQGCDNQLLRSSSGDNTADFSFDPMDASTYRRDQAPYNPLGNYNELASVPLPECAFPNAKLAVNQGSLVVGGSTVVESPTAAAALLVDSLGTALRGRALRKK